MAIKSISNTVAVVIGLNINGLGTVRALGRKGISVIAITSGNSSPSEYTRYCQKVVCPQLTSNQETLLECLVSIGKRLREKAVIFPSGDLYLSILSEHRELLDQHFYFPFASKEVVRLILNKTQFYRFAHDHSLPIATTFFPKGPDELTDIAKHISYPCLIKPSYAGLEWRRRGLKILVANTPQQLEQEFIRAYKIEQELLIQEVIPGPDNALYFSLTYFNKDHQPLAMFTGHKVRQYVPRYGISSMAQSEWNPEIAEKTIHILSMINYQGYGSIEFKKDPRDGHFKIIEVTAMTWYPHALSERCGINLPFIAYYDLLGLEHAASASSFPDGVKWIDEVGDFKRAFQYWWEGKLTLSDWMRSYRGKRYYTISALDDPLPSLILGYQLGISAMKSVICPLIKPFRHRFKGGLPKE